METVRIISHLTPEEWKRSFQDKVVEDTDENMRAYQQTACYWGHFKEEGNFVLCHHKEYEIKSMSLGLYFNGRLETEERGSCITGKFGKKRSANLFLAMGAALSLVVLVSAAFRADFEMLSVSGLLFVLLLLCYLSKPKKGQKQLLEQLEKISFDEGFHKEDTKNP